MLNPRLQDHLKSPKNVGHPGVTCQSVRVTNPVCGDIADLYLVESPKGIELYYEASACSAVLSFFSWATEHLHGSPRERISEITVADLVEAAGGLPPGKSHAADMLKDALVQLVGPCARGGGA